MFDIDVLNEEDFHQILTTLWGDAMNENDYKKASYWLDFDVEHIFGDNRSFL